MTVAMSATEPEQGHRAEGRTGAAVVRVEHLSKSYGTRPALVEVSFAIERGEVFGYLGPNGAGKTTTIRVLLGFLRASAGNAEIFGLDSWRDSTRIHQRVGYVPGEVTFWKHMTGRHLLGYLAALRGPTDLAYSEALAERLDLDLDQIVTTLSKGNRQKVAIVQALMSRPDLLILDEPTSGLDPLVQQEVHDLIREHAGRGGTVLLSSHVLSEVQRTANRIGIIRAGSVVAVERLDDLRAKALHRVSARFATAIDTGSIARIEGVQDVSSDGTTVTCRAQQRALDALIKEIAEHHVIDLSCEEAGLEEMFLAYYNEARG